MAKGILKFVEYKIKDLKERKKKVSLESSAWAMDMSIGELKEVKEFIKRNLEAQNTQPKSA